MIRSQTCPICHRELGAGTDSDLFPFCSERCRQIDLLRWSTGRYAIIEPLDPNRSDPDSTEDEANPDEGEAPS